MRVGSEIKILDCTIRDGGYYTNWDFSKSLIKQYLHYINQLPIEYIEVGYRSKLKKEYLGEYFYLPLSTIKHIKQNTSKKLAIMLDAKDCKIKDIDSLLRGLDKDIALVRIATDPNKIEFSLELAKGIKKLGFDVALNIMYISKLDDKNIFFDYLKEMEGSADILNLVDSYGSVYPHELKPLIEKVKSKTNIALGFHGHNNLELAFANTLEAIESGVRYIDSTILGMGRGAGNLKTELFLAYLKSKQNLAVDLNTLGKSTELFSPLQAKYKWGTNLAYMTSGSYSLPQKDVMDALEIDRYSLSGIVNQLKNDSNLQLPKFAEEHQFDNCLIIGGGASIDEHFEAINEFIIRSENLLVIHSTSKYIELFEEISASQYFAVAGDELLKLEDTCKIDKYVLEPSPRKLNTTLDNKSNMHELEKISFIDAYHDSPLAISLQLALDTGTSNIYLAGFDGYSEFKTKKELYLMQENQTIIDNFDSKKELISLTSTKYKNLQTTSVYGLIV